MQGSGRIKDADVKSRSYTEKTLGQGGLRPVAVTIIAKHQIAPPQASRSMPGSQYPSYRFIPCRS